MSVASELDRLERALRAGAPVTVRYVQDPPATVSDIARAEAKLGWPLPQGLKEIYAVTRDSMFLSEFALRDPVSAVLATLDARMSLAEEDRPWQVTPDRGLPWISVSRTSDHQLVFEADGDLPGRVFMFDDYPDIIDDDAEPTPMWFLIGHDTESYLAVLGDFVEAGYLNLERVVESDRGELPAVRWTDRLGHGFPTLDDANAEVAELLHRHGLHQVV